MPKIELREAAKNPLRGGPTFLGGVHAIFSNFKGGIDKFMLRR